MKKIICLVLTALMLLSCAACAAGAPMDDMYPGADMDGSNGLSPAPDQYYNYNKTDAAMEVVDVFDGQVEVIAPIPSESPDDSYQDPDIYDVLQFIENQFIKVSESPVSTFSADVDTASYTYFRKLVSQGYTLDNIISMAGVSMRTEEMLNYFSYDYKGPQAGQLFGVNAYITKCPWNPNAELLTIGLRADDAVESAGNNLVFLIDVSGSMRSQDKLELLKTSFKYLTDQLTEKDTVSIVTYSGNERVVLKGCPGSQKQRILEAVNSLEAGGSTNGEAGLVKAYSLAADYFIEGGNNRIIMASDGDLNVGISSAEELEKFVEQKREQGIYLSVLGFGTGNYRDANMEAIADNGNGVYYYIDGAAEAEKIFGQDLLGTLYTVAKDVKLQLTFDPEYVESYRLVGYENRLLNKEDFDDDTKDAGEVGAGHTVTVCYEIVTTDTASGADAPWVKLAIRHKAPDAIQSQLNEYSIGTANRINATDDIKFMCAVIETAMLLHKSEYAEGITLADIIADLDKLDLSGDYYKAEFKDILKRLAK